MSFSAIASKRYRELPNQALMPYPCRSGIWLPAAGLAIAGGVSILSTMVNTSVATEALAPAGAEASEDNSSWFWEMVDNVKEVHNPLVAA
jgi:hypothetical protein